MSGPDSTESTGMGGAGSGGDSATGTGAPPGAGGPGGQPIAPEDSRHRPKSKRESESKKTADLPHGGQRTDETGNIVGGVPRVSAAGMREDAEAGAFTPLWAVSHGLTNVPGSRLNPVGRTCTHVRRPTRHLESELWFGHKSVGVGF
jgi:hypothetical protein